MDQMDMIDEDFDLLVDALEAWKSRNLTGEMAGIMFDAMLTGGDPVKKAEMEKRRTEEKRKRDDAARVDRERAVIVQAKLVLLRDRLRIERATQVTR